MLGSQNNSVTKSVENPPALSEVVNLLVGVTCVPANVVGRRVVRGGMVGVSVGVNGKAREVHRFVKSGQRVSVKGVSDVVFVGSVEVDDNVVVLFPNVAVETSDEHGRRVVVAGVGNGPVQPVVAAPVVGPSVPLVVGGGDCSASVSGVQVVRGGALGIKMRVVGQGQAIHEQIQSGEPVVVKDLSDTAFVGSVLVDSDTVILVPSTDVTVITESGQRAVVAGLDPQNGRAESNVTRMTA